MGTRRISKVKLSLDVDPKVIEWISVVKSSGKGLLVACRTASHLKKLFSQLKYGELRGREETSIVLCGLGRLIRYMAVTQSHRSQVSHHHLLVAP